MKQLEFTTRKGTFLIIDFMENLSEFTAKNTTFTHEEKRYNLVALLKTITEEQASEVVDENKLGYFLYENGSNNMGWVTTGSAIDSLHSLIKSKGFHLFENPLGDKPYYPKQGSYDALMTDAPTFRTLAEKFDKWKESESRTLKNPVIFKLIE